MDTLEVRSGSGEAVQPEEELRGVEAKLKELLAPFLARSSASCRELKLSREELKARPEPHLEGLAGALEEAETRLAGAREGRDRRASELEAARVEKARLEQERAGREAERGHHQDTVARIVAEAGSEQAVEQAYQEARRERDAARARVQELQEKLFVLTRLALARYLASAEGRLLFVLDDPLVNSDPVRHHRLVELLEEATEDLQVVVRTCHPERCRGVAGGYYRMAS
ncbi:hypothetical protein LIP_0449 [Limnochorda pilosa]|uniref:Uncharacterized protein n=1 Tax=Limnochorda pilosa TaxID=1555112 RepID=A0A0K2SGR6_LIMPI|nr:hypothetical protein LIP_0449 [Limnochorda pilosa]